MSRNSSSASLLEYNVAIVGDVNFNGNLYIEGQVHGNISAPLDSAATLYLQESAEVTGQVSVPTIVISGKVQGDVYATRQLALKANATIVGNVHYSALEIESGATVNGLLTCITSQSYTE